ncbi:hypothetical protein SLS56_005654 [Neofusicoccum ribis]|uniref:Protein kinase domain-containing protein n=1 Tax=Neofusicoccum ribis TaxID=45134 RepID=A0ABR3SUS3_9PEZI
MLAAMDWLRLDREKRLEALRREIRNTLEQEMQGPKDDDEQQFLPYEQVEQIWIHREAPNSYFERFAKVLKLKDRAKDRVRSNHLRILSTLVWIRFDQWTQYFMKEFVPEAKERVDDKLPFDESELQQPVFDFARAFFKDQFRFLPIKIYEMEPTTYLRAPHEREPEHQRCRMPFLRKEAADVMHERLGIKVTREKIAANHMIKKNGKPNNKPKVMAVKSFPAARFSDFQQEKQNLELLKDSIRPDPNILFSFAAVQIGQSSGNAFGYIISDLADCNLHELLFGECDGFKLRMRAFTPYSLLSEMKGISSAIQWLHAGIRKSSTRELVRCTHMDLKPSNVLIFWEDPDEARWKISDFGISVVRHVDHVDPGDRTLTFTRARQYPAEYQAPEVEFHNDQVGSPSDVWSFGCILMEVVAFIIGGPDTVLELQQLRNREVPNNFYSNDGLSHKRILSTWLRNRHQAAAWMPQMSILIESILEVNYDNRPRAQGVLETLRGIIDQYEGSGIHKICPWTAVQEPPIISPTSDSTPSLSTYLTADVAFPHLELKSNLSVTSSYIGNFGPKARSRMSLEGEWVMFRTVDFAYARRIKDLVQRESPVPLKDIEQDGIVLKHRSYQIEAISAAGGFVAVLFCHPRDVESKKDRGVPRGGTKNILLPWRGSQTFGGLEPRFLTMDIHGNGSIIGEEGETLSQFQFARKYDGIVHGCVIPSGTSVLFIRRGHLNSPPGFVLLDLAPSISKKWQPVMREVGISSSFIDLYDPKSDDFVLQESGSKITAYLSGPTKKFKNAVVIRKADLAPP